MDPGLVEIFRDVMDYTADGTEMTFNVCINYGSRHEITAAVRAIAKEVKEGKLDPGDIDEETVTAHLYTADQPDPDLLIRTSGEERLSNFLLWQAAYTEFYFNPGFVARLWPDGVFRGNPALSAPGPVVLAGIAVDVILNLTGEYDQHRQR